MAISSFIPQIWDARLLNALDKAEAAAKKALRNKA